MAMKSNGKCYYVSVIGAKFDENEVNKEAGCLNWHVNISLKY